MQLISCFSYLKQKLILYFETIPNDSVWNFQEISDHLYWATECFMKLFQSFINLSTPYIWVCVCSRACACSRVFVHVCVLNGWGMSYIKIYAVIHSWYLMDETEKDRQMIEKRFDTYWSLLIILCILRIPLCSDSQLIFLLKKHGIASYRQDWKRKRNWSYLSWNNRNI